MAGVTGLSPLVPTLYNGVLSVIGDSRANTIEVTKSGSTIAVLGRSFAASQVKSIAITGEGGDDTIKVSEAITVPTYLYGGWGTDTIYGGGGVDHIYGGQGGDKIYGRGGADEIFGGAGADVIDGGLGADAVLDAERIDRVLSAETALGESATLVAYSGFKRDVITEIVRLVNVERKNRGLSPLSLNSALNAVASEHTSDMQRLAVPVGQGISHAFSGDLTPTVSSRLDANQVVYSTYAENNSSLSNSASKTAVQVARAVMYGWDGKGGWMNSTGHRANILNASVKSLGMGMSGSSLSSGYYFTQVFTG